MAKTKKLPPSRGKSKESEAIETQSEATATPQTTPEKSETKDRSMPLESVALEVPMAEKETGLRPKRIDVRVPIHLRSAADRFVVGLRTDGAKFGDREVVNISGAFIWFLEQLEAGQ